MIDMYRNALGWAEHKPGDEKHEPTHKLLTNEEYEGLEYNDLRLNALLREKEEEIKRIKENNSSRIYYIKQQAQEEIEKIEQDAREKINAAEEEAEYQKNLNTTLLEISKNRANADRNLKPKKEHTGYIVESSSEKNYKYKHGSKIEEIKVWETLIQTPYVVDFSEEQVRTQSENDLFADAGEWLIGKIGIGAVYCSGVDKLMKDEEYRDKNCIIESRLRANYKKGYWEIIYVHTKPLGVVPKDMRA